MANYGPTHAFILVGGRNLSSDTYVLDETLESLAEETHGLGDSWEEYTPVGIGRITLEASGGLYDDRTGGIVEALQSKGTTKQLMAYGFKGTATGAKATMLDGSYAATWKRMADRGGLTKAHAVHTLTGGYKEGLVLHGLTAETTASGSGTAINNGGSSTGGTFDLHVPALTLGGYTNVVIKVQDSPDDNTYSDLVTFTSVTALTSERKTITGTVAQYTKMTWSFTGSGSGMSITPFVSISRP